MVVQTVAVDLARNGFLHGWSKDPKGGKLKQNNECYIKLTVLTHSIHPGYWRSDILGIFKTPCKAAIQKAYWYRPNLIANMFLWIYLP